MNEEIETTTEETTTDNVDLIGEINTEEATPTATEL
jgi:hypothetical protein